MNRYEDEVELLDALCKDPDARRELLWLRAKEKEDDESLRSLERVDPTLRGRLADVARRVEAEDDDRERSEAWGREWDERYEWHMARLAAARAQRPVASR